MDIFYYDKKTLVRLYDIVEIKKLFGRIQGSVVYVPGVSGKHQEMEIDGLEYVGISVSDSLYSFCVDPELHTIPEKVIFRERGSENCNAEVLLPNEKLS